MIYEMARCGLGMMYSVNAHDGWLQKAFREFTITACTSTTRHLSWSCWVRPLKCFTTNAIVISATKPSRWSLFSS